MGAGRAGCGDIDDAPLFGRTHDRACPLCAQHGHFEVDIQFKFNLSKIAN
ncbi:MAG: hypothetical protein HC908_13160 [Calothrix sp. SM1_7_51]|nr:hypothetical protein [Calothrix sp. SM1_7_51]